MAAGEALRRLTANTTGRAHAKPIADAVGAARFGVGAPGGTEALSHAVQVGSGRRPGAAFVALDMRNAFPSLDRDAVLAFVVFNKAEDKLLALRAYRNSRSVVGRWMQREPE